MSVRGGDTYSNLFDTHPPFQIDGNFGGTTGKAQKNDTTYIPPKRLTPPEGITCYKVAVDRNIVVTGRVVNEEGELYTTLQNFER